MAPHRRRKVGVHIRAIRVQQDSLVANWPALHQWAPDQPLDLHSRVRHPGSGVDQGLDQGGVAEASFDRQVAPRCGLTLTADPVVRHQPGKVALQRAPRERGKYSDNVVNPDPPGVLGNLRDDLVVYGRGYRSRHLEGSYLARSAYRASSSGASR